jgi:hypothetical protein
MDVGRSFSYVTDDEEWWKKILIGGLLTLIPVIGGFYGMGYMIETLTNVIRGREVPLPEAVDDFGGKLVKGLLSWVISLIYALPLIIVSACAGAGSGVFANAIDDPQTGETVGVVWSVCFGCVSFLYGILMGLVLPFALATYADTGQLGDALKLGKIFGMLKENIGPAFVVLLVSMLAGILAAIAGTILCGIGLFVTALYAQLVMAYLYGNLYLKAKPAVL